MWLWQLNLYIFPAEDKLVTDAIPIAATARPCLFFLDLGCLQSKTLGHRQSADDFRIFFHIADFIITMRILPGENIVGSLTEEEH